MLNLFEVEYKAYVENIEKLKDYLNKKGFKGKKIDFWDYYFDHPCRSFEESDEELRVRVDHAEGKTIVTYKGPSKLEDRSYKEELETIVLGKEIFIRILNKLSFECKIAKRKVGWLLTNGNIEVTLVSVYGLYMDRELWVGDFVEVEIKVSSEDDVPMARKNVLDFIKSLPFTGEIETKYYTELIKEKIDRMT